MTVYPDIISTDTIVAIATGSQTSAVGVVRISGSRAIKIGRQLFRPAHGVKKFSPRKMYFGSIHFEGGEDDVLYVEMPGPQSYTGEDIVEVHSHGHPTILQQIVFTAIDMGAREAKPGEFTQRAYQAGKLTLFDVEEIASIFSTENQRADDVFLRNTKKQLGKSVDNIKKHLLSASTAIEAALNYPEECPLQNIEELRDIFGKISTIAQKLLENQRIQQRLREGLRIVVAGPPNAGKSTLINTLTTGDRVLVDEQAGTTRDSVEIPWVIGQCRVLFIDTAGICESDNSVEQAGIHRALHVVESADIVLWLNPAEKPDRNPPLPPVDERADIIRIASKADLPDDISHLRPSEIPLSSHNGKGIPELQRAIDSVIQKDIASLHLFGRICSSRQHRLIQQLSKPAQRIRKLLFQKPDGWPLLCGEELREMLDIVSQLDGSDVQSEVLDQIFSQFCIGK